MWVAVTTTILLLAGIAPASAAAAPELLNKTIQVRFTTSTPIHRDNGQDLIASPTRPSTYYISSAGRAFFRGVEIVDSPLNRATRERAPGENAVQLQGCKIIQVQRFTSGAGLMEIEVDPSASSCRATVTIGRESGRPLRWKGVNGMWATATGPMVVSNVSCSISAGNGLAQ